MIKENYPIKVNVDQSAFITPPKSKLLADSKKLASVRERVKKKLVEIGDILNEE